MRRVSSLIVSASSGTAANTALPRAGATRSDHSATKVRTNTLTRRVVGFSEYTSTGKRESRAMYGGGTDPTTRLPGSDRDLLQTQSPDELALRELDHNQIGGRCGYEEREI